MGIANIEESFLEREVIFEFKVQEILSRICSKKIYNGKHRYFFIMTYISAFFEKTRLPVLFQIEVKFQNQSQIGTYLLDPPQAVLFVTSMAPSTFVLILFSNP